MIEPISTPPPWLKAGAFAAKWALRLLATAWMVLALVWGALHFLIVPRIGDFRPWIEAQATQLVGASVRIRDISAQSNGLMPSIALQQVTLLDAQGRDALVLPSVTVALSARSLLNGGFEQLYIDAPVLDVRRTADGKVWIAGFALPETQESNSVGSDWLFAQPEVAIRNGTVNWTDELRGVAPLSLRGVDLVLRNSLLSHALRLDASPPVHWGERFSVLGSFRQPLLSRRDGNWKEWTGQLYAHFPNVDTAQLRPYADIGVDIAQGNGEFRAWLDVKQATITGATADVALRNVNVRVAKGLEPLALKWAAGRLGVRAVEDGGSEYFTQALEFDTEDGLHWPGGNVRMALYPGDGKLAPRGVFNADKLDLAAMVQISERLPLPEEAREAIVRFAPRGLVEKVESTWQGDLPNAVAYSAKGRITQLVVPASTRDNLQTPGVSGLDVDFDLNQDGGKGKVAMTKGVLDLLGIMEPDSAAVPVDQLGTDVEWTLKGGALSVNLPNLRFANEDAQGEVQLKWQGSTKPGDLGVLDLQGGLSRANGTKVYRYLPSVLDKALRDYLRDAILAGTASGVKFKLKGDLAKFPFENDRQGDFRISANIQNATYAYVPASLTGKDSPPWPALTQLNGELVIDQDVLQIKNAKALLGGLQVTKGEATVTRLYGSPLVTVNTEGKGLLADALGIVNNSLLDGLSGHALARASVKGVADYRLKLAFPLDAVEKIAVQGAVVLSGNDVQIAPETPRLVNARGTIAFTEKGLTVSGGQARALGGDVRIDGGLSFLSASTAGPNQALRIQGTASAEGVRQAKELGFAARLAQYASGASTYSAVLGLRGGVPQLQINSSLAGLALNLPAPFNKTAEATLPLRLETSAVPNSTGQDQLLLELGRLATVTYVRDVSGATVKVLRGAIGVGLAADESAPVPDTGVVANVNIGSVDLDAWNTVLSGITGGTLNAAPDTNAGMAYLPTVMAVRAREVVMGGRKLNNVVIGGGRDGLLWRANLDAGELSGYVEYRQPTGPNAGRVYARLARLVIAPSVAQDVEALLDEQPTTIPALDVVVEDFELRGKKLGTLEVQAVNTAVVARDGSREWKLNAFNIVTPEATLTATGNWASVNPGNNSRNIRDRRKTALNFRLDVADAGQLLSRFGMNGVVRGGKGKLEGQIAWLGSPFTLDYPSLGGSFNVNIENGQFLKAEPGIAKLLGVLSLQSLPRRLTLDFRDVFSDGFAFDFFRGDMVITQGIARTNNLQMKGVNAAVFMEGQADIGKETQNLRVLVVPEINAGSASLITAAINPIWGLGTFLAQVILRRPLIDAATQEFTIDGTWLDPRMTKVDRKPAETPAKP